jgi:NAD(P)-dependent dehydrogenase (short-subunit alcohol dehydrogenase family)
LQIKNKTFVITGAAQGLGEAISVALARQGANLALLDINADRPLQPVNRKAPAVTHLPVTLPTKPA